MDKAPNIEQAIERARRAQEHRVNVIRDVATAREELNQTRKQTSQELDELKAKTAERIKTAQSADTNAYRAALKAGWTREELRDIGFTEPSRKTSTRSRRRAPSKTSTPTTRPAPATQTEETENHDA